MKNNKREAHKLHCVGHKGSPCMVAAEKTRMQRVTGNPSKVTIRRAELAFEPLVGRCSGKVSLVLVGQVCPSPRQQHAPFKARVTQCC